VPLKNYTTEISAMKSIGEIQGKLVAHGASAVMINYGPDREPRNLSFIVPTHNGDLPFRLPANVKKVEAILLSMRATKPESWHRDYKKTMERIQKQAARVAWRILKDWVDAQLAIIETEMVTLEQVFLPYLQIKGEQTLYEAMVDRGFYLKEGKESDTTF